jgi:hypothetical protein
MTETQSDETTVDNYLENIVANFNIPQIEKHRIIGLVNNYRRELKEKKALQKELDSNIEERIRLIRG